VDLTTTGGTGRRSVLLAASAGLLLAVPTPGAAAAAPAQSRTARRRPVSQSTAVLVHGAFADGSSWAPVVARLQAHDVPVVVVQLSLNSLTDDVAVLTHRLSRIPGRKVVAAHSYGGIPVSEADYTGLDVGGLVFAAAYATDAGESLLSLNATADPLPAADPSNTLVDLEAQQLVMTTDAFTRYFCPDLPRARRAVLAAVQRPIGFGAGGTPASHAAWKTLPTWYQVSLDDQVVSPDLQRRLAGRMPDLRRRLDLRSSHASIQSHPQEVADLVLDALRETRLA
jgi:pimeloyl-ACP methyl ester carboxylesterase